MLLNKLGSVSEILSADPMIKEVVFTIIGLLVPALIGAVITYFSQPLIERRMAKIRVAEKIADRRLQSYEALWTIVASIDKSKIINSNKLENLFCKKYPFVEYEYETVSNEGLILPAIFEDFIIYQSFINDIGKQYITSSVFWDSKTVRSIGYLNAYLTNVNIFLVYAREEIFKFYGKKDILADDQNTELFNLFIKDVGVLCNSEIHEQIDCIRQSIMNWYAKPSISFGKKDLDFNRNTINSTSMIIDCVTNKYGRQIIDGFLRAGDYISTEKAEE